jgi:hypothetical protein
MEEKEFRFFSSGTNTNLVLLKHPMAISFIVLISPTWFKSTMHVGRLNKNGNYNG